MEPCAIVPLTQFAAAAVAPAAGEAALARVVRSLRGAVDDARVVVATVPALAAGVRQCLREAGLAATVVVASAPGSRYQAIRAGLEHLGAEPYTRTSVLICDHRYPLSPVAMAQRVLGALADGHDVAVPVLPVTDTVKTVDDLGAVLGTVDRSVLRVVQYPRAFTASALWQLVSGTPVIGADDVDEFSGALRAGLDVRTVAGDADSPQLEMPGDAPLLAALMACRPD
jgi:2-C-methyl-D-erythritol 4-phosphate cytidylyltransferase